MRLVEWVCAAFVCLEVVCGKTLALEQVQYKFNVHAVIDQVMPAIVSFGFVLVVLVAPCCCKKKKKKRASTESREEQSHPSKPLKPLMNKSSMNRDLESYGSRHDEETKKAKKKKKGGFSSIFSREDKPVPTNIQTEDLFNNEEATMMPFDKTTLGVDGGYDATQFSQAQVVNSPCDRDRSPATHFEATQFTSQPDAQSQSQQPAPQPPSTLNTQYPSTRHPPGISKAGQPMTDFVTARLDKDMTSMSEVPPDRVTANAGAGTYH